jgi:molybdopterin/thiamine biosynthesis adenylyltransferase
MLIDFDDVSLSNLQRQVLFDTADVGRPKVERAAERLRALNPSVAVQARRERLDPENAARLIAGADVVIDGSDDFATRFAVNDACVRARTPLVSAAVGRWGGQLGVFEGGPCWRCLVPETPPQTETCAAVGVIGALTGVIGSAAALEAIKLAAGTGEPLTGRLLVYDGLAAEARVVRVAADPTCPTCGGRSWRNT